MSADPITVEDIHHRFTYHAPKPGQPERYEQLRSEARKLALLIRQMCPHSRERSLAITELESAIMWANASIARNGKPINGDGMVKPVMVANALFDQLVTDGIEMSQRRDEFLRRLSISHPDIFDDAHARDHALASFERRAQ